MKRMSVVLIVFAAVSCGDSDTQSPAKPSPPENDSGSVMPLADGASPREADTSIPLTLTPCPSADGGGMVGQWQNITPPYVIAHPTYTGTLVPMVNPQNPSIVYVTTDSDGIFKSLDCGATWNQVNTGTNGDQLDMGRIWGAVMDPTNPNTIYALTGYGPHGLWKSTNGGIDWAQLFQPGTDVVKFTTGFVERISVDPGDSQHLLIDFHQGGNCSGTHTPVCLAESKNGGQDWTLVDVPTSVSSAPQEANGIAFIDATTWIIEESGSIFRTKDSGKNWTPVTPAMGGKYTQLVGNGSVFHNQDGTYFLASQEGVIMSKNGADGLAADWTSIQKSGSWLGPILGDDKHVYTAGLPNGNMRVWSATYDDLNTWTEFDTGLPQSEPQGLYANPYTMAIDTAHHLLYMASNAAGLWRVAIP